MKERYVKTTFNNVAGEEYNGNLAIMYLFSDEFSHDFWVFRCPYCKNFFIARLDMVKSEQTKSCGCLRNRVFRENVQNAPVKSQVKRYDSLKEAYCSEIISKIEAEQENNTYRMVLCNIYRDKAKGLIDDSVVEQQTDDVIRMYLLNNLENNVTL